MADVISSSTAEESVPVLNRPEASGWRSALWPLAMLGLIFALIVQSCIDQPAIPPRFDAAAVTRDANSKARQALETFTEDAAPTAVAAALSDMVIPFAFHSTQIPTEADAVLKAGAQALLALPADTRIQLIGHTDNQGSALKNLGLSLHRAHAVRDALVRLGVDAARLEVSGAGDSRPLASNATEAGRFANRRIEFVAVVN